jgi:hypothetical protein
MPTTSRGHGARAAKQVLSNPMTARRFFDWQTSGGADDVMRLVDCLERADVAWCAIGEVAVDHWAKEPMVTQDKDLADIARLVEAHLPLWSFLGDDLKPQIEPPANA